MLYLQHWIHVCFYQYYHHSLENPSLRHHPLASVRYSYHSHNYNMNRGLPCLLYLRNAQMNDLVSHLGRNLIVVVLHLVLLPDYFDYYYQIGLLHQHQLK